jgi:hypothetical protein
VCARGLRAWSRRRSRADADPAQFGHRLLASVEAVEKERAILDRLDRIDGLKGEGAPAAEVLDEVRALLAEAEEWVREDPAVPPRAVVALELSQRALAAGERTALHVLVGD